MTYEKPTATLLNSAIDAIQCESKKAQIADCADSQSVPAYEADE
jgi:hypothetical protein